MNVSCDQDIDSLFLHDPARVLERLIFLSPLNKSVGNDLQNEL